MASKNGTLAASTEAAVTFSTAHRLVTVVNLSPTDIIWARADGTEATAAGDDCYAVLPEQSYELETNDSEGPTAVSLISSGTPAYSVVVD